MGTLCQDMYPRGTLCQDTLPGHPMGTVCQDTYQDSLPGHPMGTLCPDTLWGHSARTPFGDTLPGHPLGTLCQDTLWPWRHSVRAISYLTHVKELLTKGYRSYMGDTFNWINKVSLETGFTVDKNLPMVDCVLIYGLG